MRGAAPTLTLRGTVPDRLSVFERLFRGPGQERHRIAPDGIGQRTRPHPLDGPAKRDTGKARLSVANHASFVGAVPGVRRNPDGPRRYFCGRFWCPDRGS